MSELVIAAVAAPVGRDLCACLRTIERALQEARVCGAGLVVLPEAALGGHAEPLDCDPSPVLEIGGPELARVVELARDLTVCVGFREDGGDGIRHNSAAVLTGDGVIGVHRAVHMCEDRLTTPGDRLETFDTPVGRIGMLIGYDKPSPRPPARSRSTERRSSRRCRRGRAAPRTRRRARRTTASGAARSCGIGRGPRRTR